MGKSNVSYIVMNTEIQILPLHGLVLGFQYYSTRHEDWWVEDECINEYYEHYTIFLGIIAIRILRE